MNKQPFFNLKNGLLFPIQFQILGYVLLFAGLALIVINIWASIIFILLGGVIVTALSGIEIKNDKFREYNSFFFIKNGKWEPLRKVEKIFIKRVKVSQKFYGRANQSSTSRNVVYKAFLKFENGQTIFLSDHKNKGKVESKLKEIADFLKTEIIDYTN
ncbi:hypothetical protein MATR_36540 [Marivirga tractuosa]|uniref:Uncharacterized protein n=1 Tax=Marivirga tractuosa (strain ATCC 23168 / DSM 4126 / NBRC 15989 / NCIMB 1408 / VKM B-1430 / H-43) TaxID=643867 RepID=E4TNT6_MARTH|nr:hypothetical protein [Marivirga tractuosa]ADR22500.1 hypothetical protein Ftrac_2522 [Marivirga tractuosa DSM 4126]BDD16829.1 hypothetical protein MATR_36540 [Marivirga tractuosa]